VKRSNISQTVHKMAHLKVALTNTVCY